MALQFALLILLLPGLSALRPNPREILDTWRTSRRLSEQESDRVTRLPGQPAVEFDQYSGYITVNQEAGRALFYWFTEAATDAASKPLVLWLNGGPGCSSLAYGAAEEIGPFFINKTGSSLYLNPHSWNRDANIIFLESPAGVGYSYTNTSSDLTTSGDGRTAEDAYNFLVGWMERFPQYNHRDFYIAGESYAGHYVPQLAHVIHHHNKNVSSPAINFKGFMVGNAVTDSYHDNVGLVDYWYSHAMISDETFFLFRKVCNFRVEDVSKACNNLFSQAYLEQGEIDPYSIYTPACLTGPNAVNVSFAARLRRLSMNGLRFPRGYDPCSENNAEIYFNRPDVQKALHANTTGIPYPWTACSNPLFDNWQDSVSSVLSIYKEMIDAGKRIWVYSGDADSVVPVTGTRYALDQLYLPIKTKWYAWYYNQQVGGRSVVYDGLTFVTIRGSGHEVPLLHRGPSLALFRGFLRGEKLSSLAP